MPGITPFRIKLPFDAISELYQFFNTNTNSYCGSVILHEDYVEVRLIDYVGEAENKQLITTYHYEPNYDDKGMCISFD